MIDKKKVIKLVEEKLDDKMFLIDVLVSTNNNIHVFVDSFDGMTIEKCIQISRNVEHNLDRDVEDFELQVSSPGLTESFKVKEQYYKYKDREIEVVLTNDLNLKGILLEADDTEIVLKTSERKKVEGHKKKQLVTEEHTIKYDEIKSAKAVISFK